MLFWAWNQHPHQLPAFNFFLFHTFSHPKPPDICRLLEHFYAICNSGKASEGNKLDVIRIFCGSAVLWFEIFNLNNQFIRRNNLRWIYCVVKNVLFCWICYISNVLIILINNNIFVINELYFKTFWKFKYFNYLLFF